MRSIRKKKLSEMIRVDHAGEFGAQRIYSGQIKFTKDKKLKKVLEKIATQEKVHLEYFEKFMIEKQVRPTIMHSFWNMAGFSLGAITAMLGKNYVMACTDAVETVIVDHYRKQLEEINKFDEKEIKKKLEKFLEEESEHQKAGNDNIDSEDLKIKIFKIFVKKGTDIAIKISQKI